MSSVPSEKLSSPVTHNGELWFLRVTRPLIGCWVAPSNATDHWVGGLNRKCPKMTSPEPEVTGNMEVTCFGMENR